MNAKIDEMTDDIIHNAQRRNLDLDELVAALKKNVEAAKAGSPAAGSTTIAEYAPVVLRVLAGKLTQTQRTYKTGLDLLVFGIVLHWAVPNQPPKPWTDEEVDTWLGHARAINRERNFSLDLPLSAATCARTSHGAAIVWPGFGHLPVASLTMSQVVEGGHWAQLRSLTTDAVRREQDPKRGRKHFGDGAFRTYIGSVRYLYKVAQGDQLVPSGHNPAAHVSLKGTAPGTRQPITLDRVRQAERVFCETGDDPELDSWLFFFHRETGARQEGAWNLKLLHLDLDKALIYIPDKGSKAKAGKLEEADAVPVRRELLEALIAFAASRGASDPDDHVFRSKRRDPATGLHRPITRRRYNTIYGRMRRHTDWAEERNFGVHHLRGFVAGAIEDRFGRRFKMRFLRHKPNGQTDRYGPASFDELAEILRPWFTEPTWPETPEAS